MARERSKEELEKERIAKSASYERKLNNNNNKFVIISAIVIVLGYLFFLLSPKLFHEPPERFYTELGSNVIFTGGTITPNSWVYSEDGKMMQVEFTFKSNQTLTPEIEVTAATSFDDRTKVSTKIKSEIIYHDSDFYIANIYDVPDDYYCVSLRIKTLENSQSQTVNEKDGLGNEVVRQLTETENATEEKKEITSTAVVYTCRDAVKKVKALYRLDDYIYRIKKIQSNINLDYATISDNNSSIESFKSKNGELEIRNNELKNDMLYMTSSEKQIVQREIENNSNKIGDNIAQIKGLEENNINLQTEIHEYEEIIRRIAAENENRKYIEPTENTQATTETIAKPTTAPTQVSTQKRN